MKFFLATAAAAAALSASGGAHAQAEDWVEVIRHPDGPMFIDGNSIRRQGSSVTVVSRSDFDEVQADGTKAFRVRYRYDCANRTSDLLYLEQIGSDGRIMLSGDVPAEDRQAEPIPAGSPNEAIFTRLCS